MATMHARQRLLFSGASLGFAFATVMTAFLQIQPRLISRGAVVFTGAPLGLDQWVYTALARAILRSANGITYAYPFALFWPAPPVLVQLPLAAVGWLSKLVGFAAAFEILRIVGAAGTGAALAVIGFELFRNNTWRRWFYVAAAFGGGWFTFLAIAIALQTAGVYGLTELDVYVQRAMGPLYWWLPFLAQNIWSPLEAVYHALVLGALAFLLSGRKKLAALVGMFTWFSHPFSAVALYAPALVWLAAEVLLQKRGRQRYEALQVFMVWMATALAGIGYYALLLPRWPVLRELSLMHQVPIAPPPTFAQLIAWFAPVAPAVLWALLFPAGRRHVWQTPAWRLMAVLFLTQLAFLGQFIILGEKATQPYHFNRGYLAIASVAFLLRWLQTLSPRRPTRTVILFLGSILLDQTFFFLRLLASGVTTGYVPAEVQRVSEVLNSREQEQVFLSQAYHYSAYLAAATDQIPYDMPETMVVPWPEERGRLLQEALAEGQDKVVSLGVSLAIFPKSDSHQVQSFKQGGWLVVGETPNYVILEVPKQKRRPIPHLPPPTRKHSLD
ncbi:MAG: hypothetical protein ACP5UB_06780 [Candidatus Sumerlaeaceae bacterium]